MDNSSTNSGNVGVANVTNINDTTETSPLFEELAPPPPFDRRSPPVDEIDPPLNTGLKSQVSKVLESPERATTTTTSIFIPPSSTRYLAVPRISYDMSTKCVIPKDGRPTKQTDLRKL